MVFKLPKRYTEKANDSFKTKRNLYLFSKALNNTWDTVGLEDFRQFSIDQDLVRVYVTIYWQYESEYLIAGERSIDEIQKDIARKETELKTDLEQFRQDYISKVFYEKFPPEKFEILTNAGHCEYCGITIKQIHELADLQKLYKKNYRGWSLEIDRKDSNFEYSFDNCVMACYWCNNAKTDEFTHEEFKRIGKHIAQIWDSRLGDNAIDCATKS